MNTVYMGILPIFPFDKVPYGAQIVIYGMGFVGKEYMKQVQATNFATIKYVVDKRFYEMTDTSVKVYSSEVLKDERAAIIVVAVESEYKYQKIKEHLLNIGISMQRIVWSVNKYICKTDTSQFIEYNYCKTGEIKDDILSFMQSVRQKLKIKSIDNVKFKRIGRENDGGYVMLDDLTQGNLAYSFGINEDVSWDAELEKMGYDVYMYDHTINSLPYKRSGFHFFAKGLANSENTDNHFDTLENFIILNGHQKKNNMILKLDIEGYEWQVLKDVDQAILMKFDQIIVEFHNIFDFSRKDEILFALQKLNQTHQVVHVHGNNYSSVFVHDDIYYPSALEVTYALRERYKFSDNKNVVLPIESDMPNCKEIKEIPLGYWNKSCLDDNLNIVIFGVGEAGRTLLKYDLCSNVHIVGVYDNDERKWGTDVFGYKVQSPSELNKTDYEKLLLTVVTIGYMDIIEQLVSMGVEENKIVIVGKYYSGFEYFDTILDNYFKIPKKPFVSFQNKIVEYHETPGSESSKARDRRIKENFFSLYCLGNGLDIGCGSDPITESCYGWDIPNGDAQYLKGIDDNSFDFVYSSHYLEHMKDVKVALKNWFRVIKKDGYLILYIPERNLYEKRKRLPSRWNPDHKHMFLLGKSEAPDTLDILEEIKASIPDGEIQYAKICSEGHSINSPLIHSDGEYSIEIVIKKTM